MYLCALVLTDSAQLQVRCAAESVGGFQAFVARIFVCAGIVHHVREGEGEAARER